MKIISFDPGLSTGICVLDDRLQILRLQTLSSDDLFESLEKIVDLERPDRAVMERLPVYMSSSLVTILEFIRRYLKEDQSLVSKSVLISVSPGEWKPIAKSRKWSVGIGSDQHQKDAYCIARYVLEKEGLVTK